MNNNTLAIALAALLVGGVAVAAFNNNRDGFGSGGLEYATVLDVEPITVKQELYAQVIDAEPERWKRINAAPPPEEVAEAVLKTLRQALTEKINHAGN